MKINDFREMNSSIDSPIFLIRPKNDNPEIPLTLLDHLKFKWLFVAIKNTNLI